MRPKKSIHLDNFNFSLEGLTLYHQDALAEKTIIVSQDVFDDMCTQFPKLKEVNEETLIVYRTPFYLITLVAILIGLVAGLLTKLYFS